MYFVRQTFYGNTDGSNKVMFFMSRYTSLQGCRCCALTNWPSGDERSWTWTWRLFNYFCHSSYWHGSTAAPLYPQQRDKSRTTKTNSAPLPCDRGHKEAVWPQHFKPSEAINYKVSGRKSSLMYIDSYCTKRQKQSMAVLSGWIPLPKYLDTMHPCEKQWSNLCLQSGQRHSVC